MLFTCVALYAFDSSRTGFVIPAFTTSDSNSLYVQDLNLAGRIEEFLPLPTNTLFSVPIFPPSISVKIGDFGLLAFVDDDGAIHLAIRDILASEIDASSARNPITRLELASLTDDARLQHSALMDCQALFTNSSMFKKWKAREKRSFGAGVRADATNSEQVKRVEGLETDFRNIEANLSGLDWEAIWLRLWAQNFDRVQLLGVVFYRQDRLIDFGDRGIEIFLLLSQSVKHSDLPRRSLAVLEQLPLTQNKWINLFVLQFYNSHSDTDEFVEVGVAKLRGWLHYGGGYSVNFVSLWNFMRRRQVKTSELRRIGIEYVLSLKLINLHTARSILLPLSSNNKDFSRIAGVVDRWLQDNVRSDVTWLTLFIKTFECDRSSVNRQLGLEWLQDLGGNLSGWVELWHMYHTTLESQEYSSLGLSWLARARRDMNAWVAVFFDLLELSGNEHKKKLTELGEYWLQEGNGSAYNRRRMRDAVKYLQAGRPT